jgi:hypothetical protein
MKRRRAHLLVGLLALVAAGGFHYLRATSSGADMTADGQAFVQTLSDQQRPIALLPYEAPQRTDWHYIPKPTRKGLQLKEMNDAQRQAALALLRSGLSAVGYGKATRIMELESVLRTLEQKRTNSPLRDPQRYFFTIFGEPNAAGRWGLSVEGHHLSLNFVVDHNQVISSTPTFFGANPATLMDDYGPRFEKGLRVLKQEEDLAFHLLASLSNEQRKTVVVADKAPSDVRDAGRASPPISPADGLAAAEMSASQVETLRSLIEAYTNNMPAEVAAERWAKIEKTGISGIKFAWLGADKPGIGHHYRVQGPSFLIEFNNTQPDSAGNVANHIHSVWHDLAGNFAIPTPSP